ncbi:threonine/serine exporter family protein [Streptomyces europaeiscabiei]|nr:MULTISPECIES: threonine/serine exporter family protein [Streptomyces]MDX3582867.1 threonine/serine exporter family protein [Streptomyces europaeiscabiei]MDX3617484.1 threonine/serine exporter family protein [Streptomyces europaeiscabiei]MDX3631559.1 threonine/serine exporter family protein [Streptomyces europaeiscabiei]MDX3649340.1 threonine/serine exporter family protein [Streptomyces europaeiscabiei]WUD38520.1 threonine/serine exporter family protein [Streptomyces europaeiscabiei]
MSDAADGAFVPVGVVLGIDGDASVTSEFAIPAGLDVPAGGAESEAQTTSEFALPEGMAPPEPVATEQEGSAFSLPRTYSARHAPVAFTPPTGIPAVSLTKDVPWQDRMRTMLRMPVAERPAPEPPARADGDSGPAVPRVLDLTLRIGELLLAGGEGAEDVEAAMFAVCRSYGLDRCEPTVTFTQLSVTHQPSLVDDPVTASRIVRRRATDYTRLAAVFQLVDDLSDPESAITLEEAYRRLAEIRRNRHPYPGWALTAASGLLAGAASVLVGGGVVVFVAAALGAMLGDRLAWLCSGRGLPEFYQFLVAAMPPAAIGVALTVTHVDVEASAVITGGLFALLPGRALVAGAHDGLTGYYITASARLLEVMYLFVGIVVGVLLVLYFGVKLGAELNPDAALGSAERPLWQLGASMLLSLTFAVLLQQERSTVLAVTLNGGVAWAVYGAMHDAGGISPVASTAVAAGVVGLFGQLLSRYRFASALPYTTAAIGPLLPGSATYFGLLAFAQNDVDAGLVSLTKAAALAMAIAIGVNLGSELFRLFLPGAARVGRRAAKRTRGF